jgi:hypothetical protein
MVATRPPVGSVQAAMQRRGARRDVWFLEHGESVGPGDQEKIKSTTEQSGARLEAGDKSGDRLLLSRGPSGPSPTLV